MAEHSFTEGVRPGGLTTGKEIRILLCYLIDNAGGQVLRESLEEVLIGEELANYFVMAESLAQLEEQNLICEAEGAFTLTETGRTVARTLAGDLPRTVRDAAVRGVIRAQQYTAKKAAHGCEVTQQADGRRVRCQIGDEAGLLFLMELYMPDKLTAEAVREEFIEHGDKIYELMLAALTGNRDMAEKALDEMEKA